MTDLFLCVDPGASQTKIIYQIKGESSPRYMLMPPDVEAISQDDLDFYFNSTGWLGHPAPLQQAWVEVDDKLLAVGAFADKFDPSDRLNELKYENALYKVLAAVGVILQQHELNPKRKLSLQLALLLPANEYNDRLSFKSQLSLYLKSFSFRGKSLKFKLESFLCRPEGGGLASITVVRNGLDWLQKRRLGVLMLGHRNVSALYFEYGEMKRVDSPLIGFSGFLNLVVKLTSGHTPDEIAWGIFQTLDAAKFKILIYDKHKSYGNKANSTQHPSWEKFEPIQKLATAKDESLRSLEIERLVRAIDSAIEQYWAKLSKWMKQIFEGELDSVIVSGGAARFLMPELEDYFNCKPIYEDNLSERGLSGLPYYHSGKYEARDDDERFTPIVWGAGLQEIVVDTFDLADNDRSLSYRLVDAYGLFDQLLGKNSRSQGQNNSSSEVDRG